MVKLLGLVDMAAVGLLLATAYNLAIPQGMVISISIYLFLKGLIFFFDIGSWFDVAAGVLLILSLSMTIPPLILFILAAILGLKGILSLFA